MSNWKSFGLAIFAAIGLLGKATGSAQAQLYNNATEWSGGDIINLGVLAGWTSSGATGINDAGQVAGYRITGEVGSGDQTATEWSGGNIINLGGLPGATFSRADGINNAGQVVVHQRQAA